ncbi:MAG: hypothetical protein IJY26_00185 [Clostridia bacterium]|nr:hypothetical protein [Clostridia bacterium]
MNQMQNNLEKRAEERRIQALVAEVEADFENRRAARRELERGWELNMNFFSGNQYCDVAPNGEIAEEDKRFYWQSRRTFNHIAPTVETRCAKLEKSRPALEVRAFSDEDADVKCARLASHILRAVSERIGLDGVISRATLWSEVCGTAFYKVLWDGNAGEVVSEDERGKIREGDVSVVPISPFEIFPDTLTAERMEDVRSIIHAKALPVSEIFESFGVRLAGRNISEFALSPYSAAGHFTCVEGKGASYTKEGYETVIERYTMPDAARPNGKLEIVAGGKLLYEGELPYRNGDKGGRILPFVRQVSLPLPGAFFGASVVDRLIPLQRAYNAVRNRKHEFLNRLSMGVVTVEDGSVDTDDLAEEGLCPGKILIYRQGSQPPAMFDCGQIPSEFEREEETIANEFVLISGTSEITRNSTNPTNVTSATGLQLLLNQEDERMAVSAHSICRAAEEIGRQILKLYKQFATTSRMVAMSGEGKSTEIFYFNAADISSDDIVFDTDTVQTPERKRAAVLELLSLGLLNDEDGKLSEYTKNKVLETLGYGNLSGARDISALHISKAEKENLRMMNGEDVEVEAYDEHRLHYTEHVRFLLSEEFSSKGGMPEKERIEAHVRQHMQQIKESKGEI